MSRSRTTTEERISDDQETHTDASGRSSTPGVPGAAQTVRWRAGQEDGCPARTRVERIAEGTTGITADTALRLSKALGTTPQLRLNLQNDYDLQMATRALGKKLAKIEPVAA